MTKITFTMGTRPFKIGDDVVNTNTCGKSHKHTYYKNGHRVYPRRSRKDCISYNSGWVSSNNCTDKRFFKVGSMVYPKCKGVNCGHFETKNTKI
jgi:hypothetical protein